MSRSCASRDTSIGAATMCFLEFGQRRTGFMDSKNARFVTPGALDALPTDVLGLAQPRDVCGQRRRRARGSVAIEGSGRQYKLFKQRGVLRIQYRQVSSARV
jgi:hypothetical protein